MIKELKIVSAPVVSTKRQDEYQEFFQKKLKDWGANSPADLSVEEKKKFFNEIEQEWT